MKITSSKGITITIPNNSKLIKIKNIDLKGRVRKDFGDVQSLADTIKDLGLIQPIDISPSKKLEDGHRRIKAMQLLGFDKVPYVIFNVKDLLQAEFIANTARKNFTVRETAIIIDRISRTPGRPKKGAKLAPFLKGKTKDVVAKITGKSPAQIQKIKDIAKAAKKEPKYEKFLVDIDKGKKSVDTVHKLVTIKQRNLPKVKAPRGKANLLVIDPPWRFDNRTIRGGADHHYDTMSLKELCELKLPLAKDAVVFLWVPNSLKYDQIGIKHHYKSTLQTLLNAWDLTAKTEFIWKKNKPAPGSYGLTYHETLLLCFRGKPVVPAKRFPSVIKADVLGHSEKPKIFFKMILEMYPKRKGFEMFARKAHPGFKPWGNQVTE